MHRRPFQHIFRWLVPVIVFAVTLCIVVAWQKAVGVGLSFLDDRTYADFAVARNLIEKQTYALYPEQPAPAVRDVLWRIAVALTALVTGDEGVAAYVLGSGFSLMTILLCLRLSYLLFPFPPFVMYSAVLLILAPSLLLTTVDSALAGYVDRALHGGMPVSRGGFVGAPNAPFDAVGFVCGPADVDTD